jgi:hypothetical protein
MHCNLASTFVAFAAVSAVPAAARRTSPDKEPVKLAVTATLETTPATPTPASTRPAPAAGGPIFEATLDEKTYKFISSKIESARAEENITLMTKR